MGWRVSAPLTDRESVMADASTPGLDSTINPTTSEMDALWPAARTDVNFHLKL